MRALAGPPTMYGPNISATRCESGGGFGPAPVYPESLQPLSMSKSERLVETLAEGMQQLQRAQLSQLEKGEKRKEEEAQEQCKPGTSSCTRGWR